MVAGTGCGTEPQRAAEVPQQDQGVLLRRQFTVYAYLSAQKLLKYQPHYDLLGSKAATNRRLRDAIELADLCADLHR